MPDPIKSQTDQIDLRLYCAQLQDTHDFVVRCGVRALRKAARLGASAHWGIQVKRIRVEFPEGARPCLVSPQLRMHNLGEVRRPLAFFEADMAER
jgi:hypothetical protein